MGLTSFKVTLHRPPELVTFAEVALVLVWVVAPPGQRIVSCMGSDDEVPVVTPQVAVTCTGPGAEVIQSVVVVNGAGNVPSLRCVTLTGPVSGTVELIVERTGVIGSDVVVLAEVVVDVVEVVDDVEGVDARLLSLFEGLLLWFPAERLGPAGSDKWLVLGGRVTTCVFALTVTTTTAISPAPMKDITTKAQAGKIGRRPGVVCGSSTPFVTA